MTKPNLFIVGAPKCGTTSIANYLSQHPQIFVCPVKEPHYFNFDSEHRFVFSEKDYLNLFRESNQDHQYLVDASVWYLYSEVAIEEILKFNPEAKFIVMLRNPVDMFYSLHQQSVFSGKENIASPLMAWNSQERRKNKQGIPSSCYDGRHLLYKEVCSLGKQVKKLKQLVSEEKIFFLTLDELKKNPDSSFLDILEFLEVKRISLQKYPVLNEKKERRFLWLAFFLKRINKLKRSFNIHRGIGLANLLNITNRKKASDKYYAEFEKMKPMLNKEFHDDLFIIKKVTGKLFLSRE